MTNRFYLALGLSTLLSILASALVIAYPFGGDPALFTTFARMMSEGADLYRDVWDVKQPGIFWFVGLGGAVFGYDEIGVHLGEAVYWLTFSVLVAIGLRPHVQRQWVAGLFPIFAMSWYFAVAGPTELTQIEAIISPIVVGIVLLLADRGSQAPTRPAVVVAGLLAGVIVVFKFLAILIPAGIFAAVVLSWLRKGKRGSVLYGLILPFSAGFALILISLLAWVVWSDLAEIVRYTWFELPPKMLALRNRPLGRLIDGTVLFFAKSAALVILAAAGLALRRKRRGDISPLLLLSVPLGGLMVVLQLWSSYHLYVMAAPLAALAVLGLDSLLNSRSRRTIIAVIIVAAIATVPAVILGARKAERLAGLASGESLIEYRSFSANYVLALAESNAIGISVGDSIYILGNPLTMQIPGANQAIPINGWSPEFWTESMWREVAQQLETSDVDALFIRDDVALLSEERAPWFLPEISEGYDVVVEIDSGSWYAPTK